MFRGIVKNLFLHLYDAHKGHIYDFCGEGLPGLESFLRCSLDQVTPSIFLPSIVFSDFPIPIEQYAHAISWMHRCPFVEGFNSNFFSRTTVFRTVDPSTIIFDENSANSSMQFLSFLFKVKRLSDLKKELTQKRNETMV